MDAMLFRRDWYWKVAILWMAVAILSHAEGIMKSNWQQDEVCGVCDIRTCSLVTADTCGGQIIKDGCGCCPVCNLEREIKPAGHAPNDACAEVACPKPKICVLNIQDLPICKCPTPIWCRQVERRERQEVCGSDGITYKSMCQFEVAECTSARKLTTKHTGSCKTKAKIMSPDQPSVDKSVSHVSDRRLNVGKLSKAEKEARKHRRKANKPQVDKDRQDRRREKQKERRWERQQERRNRRKRRLSGKKSSSVTLS